MIIHKYQENWNSIKEHKTPQWIQEAKFGIYTHWGVYSVPAYGPNGTWYPYNMYRKGSEQYRYHLRTYGHPAQFGYKDFIPMFTGEKFNADEWAELFQKAGARFAGPVAEHHDGFAMWNSKLTKWNAVKMGPKRDVVGELEKAIKQRSMKFMTAFHHAENWYFYPHWIKEFDTANPKYSRLYGPLHNHSSKPKGYGQPGEWEKQEVPNREFLNRWLAKLYEVIDGYQPDMLWFDFGLKYIIEPYKLKFLAYYYNKEKKWNRELVVIYKNRDLPPGAGLIDLERGRMDDLTYFDWITDTSVDDGDGWGYIQNVPYKSVTQLIHVLVDNVSKNGYLLLNVGPRSNGEITEAEKERLLGIGNWLQINGEAIYDTTAWFIYGEGPTKMEKSGPFSELKEPKYTPRDIRFTVKGNTLYAICLGWPEYARNYKISSLARNTIIGKISRVSLLGYNGRLQWKQNTNGLQITWPAVKPCDHAYTFKIEI
ncbi:MAG: alpha-L-fucosidase [bacterium]